MKEYIEVQVLSIWIIKVVDLFIFTLLNMKADKIYQNLNLRFLYQK